MTADDRFAAARADLGETRPALDLEAPSLVVGEMPVEDVQPVRREKVDVSLDERHGEEVARHVEVQPAPSEARGVVDAGRRDAPVIARQLPQRLARVADAAVIRGRDADPALADVEAVAL